MITDPAELPDLRLRMRERVMTSEYGYEVVRRLDAGKARSPLDWPVRRRSGERALSLAYSSWLVARHAV